MPRFRLLIPCQAAGVAQPSFAKYLLEEQPKLGLSDDELAYLAGSLFGAGSDSVSDSVTSAITHAEQCHCRQPPSLAGWYWPRRPILMRKLEYKRS
jgi:hypothetical protein